MQANAAVQLRPVEGYADQGEHFTVSASSTSIIAALMTSLLQQVHPGCQVDLEPVSSHALREGDVRVEHQRTGRSVLIFSTWPTRESMAEHLSAGEISMLCVDASSEELFTAVRSLTSGPAFISMSLIRWLAGAPAQMAPSSTLTKRERDVLALLCEGKSNAEIAAHLCISPHTVRTHLQSVFEKVGTSSRTKLMAKSRAMGLV